MPKKDPITQRRRRRRRAQMYHTSNDYKLFLKTFGPDTADYKEVTIFERKDGRYDFCVKDVKLVAHRGDYIDPEDLEEGAIPVKHPVLPGNVFELRTDKDRRKHRWWSVDSMYCLAENLDACKLEALNRWRGRTDYYITPKGHLARKEYPKEKVKKRDVVKIPEGLTKGNRKRLARKRRAESYERAEKEGTLEEWIAKDRAARGMRPR